VAHEDLLPPAAAGPVLDLGCGSGRAAVWLAERGYRVTGIDWQPEALELGRELAASRGVHCTFTAGDLRDPETVMAGPWAVVLNFRYLERPLLAQVPSLLIPGGVCLLRTFRDAPGYAGHPHRRHRLERGELLKCFPAGQFSILAHEEGFDPDGRPAAGVAARRI
jgi:SAM-dependent methyltransferase